MTTDCLCKHSIYPLHLENMIYYVPDLDKSPQYYMLHFIETTVPVLLDHQTREEVLIHNG